VHGDGHAEGDHGGGDHPVPSLQPASEHKPDGETEQAAERCDPRRPRRTALAKCTEVAGIRQLQHDSSRDPERDDAEPDEPRQHRRPAGERERDRDEARCAPCLRDGNGVRKVRKDPDEQLDSEHRERPAEDERSPALASCEAGERHERERGDGDGAAARDDLRSERVAVQRIDVQLRCVLREGALELRGRG
jgi:hypothetical protein